MSDCCYVAIRPCGCPIGVSVIGDTEQEQSWADEDRWNWIFQGYTVETWEIERVRATKLGCTHKGGVVVAPLQEALPFPTKGGDPAGEERQGRQETEVLR